MYTTCTAGILSLQFSRTMNNLSSYCGLVNAKVRASDKDLPVKNQNIPIQEFLHPVISINLILFEEISVVHCKVACET